MTLVYDAYIVLLFNEKLLVLANTIADPQIPTEVFLMITSN